MAWHSDDYAWIEFAENKPVFAINDAVITVIVSSESLTGSKANLIKKNIAQSLFYMDLVKNIYLIGHLKKLLEKFYKIILIMESITLKLFL